MQKSLMEEFNETARKLNEIATTEHDAFPEKLKNLIVFLILPFSNNTVVYVAPEIADLMIKNPIAIKKIAKRIADHMRDNNISGLADNNSYFLEGIKTKIIAVKENPFSSYYTLEIDTITSLLHEIGHDITKKGKAFITISRRHHAECSADTYALLRLIQIYGKRTDFLEYYGNNADTIVLGRSPIHYTDNVTQEIKQLSEKIDIATLSLHKTRKLAEKIAKENKLDKKTLKKISKAFLPMREAFKKSDREGWDNNDLQNCLEVMQEYNDPDIFKAGERFLSRPDIKKDLESMAKTEPYWKDALTFIENHKTNLVEDHKLLLQKQMAVVNPTVQQR